MLHNIAIIFPAYLTDVDRLGMNSGNVGLPMMYRRRERSEPLSVQQRNWVCMNRDDGPTNTCVIGQRNDFCQHW